MGASRFVERALHPLPPPWLRGVVKFSRRCCCVLQPPVILFRVVWKLITDSWKDRQCLEKSLSNILPIDTAYYHRSLELSWPREHKPSIFSHSEPDEISLPV